MLIIFCAALVFTVGRCTDGQHFATKTVGVGEAVTLTCIRRSKPVGLLFWKRVVAGNLPEVLGATYTFDHPVINQTPHFTAKQETGIYVLHIAQTKLSDTAFYYCEQIIELKTTSLNITLLTVKGPEPDITAVVQDFPSDPVHPGDSVSLQCSVLFDSEKKTCSEGHSVYWFRAGSDESHPSVIHVHRNRGDECESPEDHALQKCVYNFISSSDVGKYHCAVATCGQILFGEETKQEINADSGPFDALQHIAVYLQCAILAVSLIVLAVFISAIKKGQRESLNALHTHAAAVSVDLCKQIAEETQTYSAVVFTTMKTRGDGKTAKPKGKLDAAEKTFRNSRKSSIH